MTEQEYLTLLYQSRILLTAVVNQCGGTVVLPRDLEIWSGVIEMLKDPDGKDGPACILRTWGRQSKKLTDPQS